MGVWPEMRSLTTMRVSFILAHSLLIIPSLSRDEGAMARAADRNAGQQEWDEQA